MTEDERAMLRAPTLKLFGWWTGIVFSACIFALTFVVAALGATFLPYQTVVRGAVAMATMAFLGSYVWIQRRERNKWRRETDLVAVEANAGHVQSTIYMIRDAVAVEEHEDEGLSYFLLLDDGRALFLSGQYLYDPAAKGFPWESFEIVRVASGSWVLHVVRLGVPLTPSSTRRPFSDDEYRSGTVPADGTIESRDFNALRMRGV
jgi:hypothetical protein